MKYEYAPAWSLSPKHPEKQKAESPGPGAYQPRSSTASGVKMGRGKRSELAVKTGNPGPGTYSPEVKPRAAAAVFGSSVREKTKETSEIPGPGTYTVPSKVVEGPSWGLKGRYKPKEEDMKPGPGAYQPAQAASTDSPPAYSFPKSQQRASLPVAHAPDPGKYSPPKTKETPSWVFGRGSKEAFAGLIKDIPAPGTYTLPSTLDKRSYSISGRHPDATEKRTAFVPGPGTYNTRGKGESPQFSLGKGKRWRDSERKGVVPGPGAYAPLSRPRAASAILGTSKRPGLTVPSFSPGPGAYVVSAEKEGPQYSISGRYGVQQRANTPGPGQYDHSHYGYVLDRPATAVWGHDHKSSRDLNQSVPGPGQYAPHSKPAGPNYSFGTEKQRNWLKDDPNPGPGTYVVKAPADKRAASLSSRHPILDKKVVPGPGAYSAKSQEKTPAYSVGRGHRSDIRTSKDGPGPGQYPLRDGLNRQGGKIGTSTRNAGERVNTAPGPGNYPVGTTIGESPAYSLRGRYYTEKRQEIPGPGAYNQEADSILEHSPSVAFGHQSKDPLPHSKSTDSTGPGRYYSPLKPAGVQWSFGSEKKGTEFKSDNPGPGTYDIKSTIAVVPAYVKS